MQFSENFRQALEDYVLLLDPSPDHLIREATTGILATSDSMIIDKSVLPVFDLPRAVLDFHFEPKLLKFDDLMIGRF